MGPLAAIARSLAPGLLALAILLDALDAFAGGCGGPPRRAIDALRDSRTGEFTPMSYKRIQGTGGQVLLAKGSIGEGEAERLATAIRQAGQLNEIWLYSAGGNSAEGMKMGRLILKLGLATRVPDGALCFSACSMVFLGGVLRSVDPGGHYGVHMWTRYGEDDAARILAVLKKALDGAKTESQQQALVKDLKELLQSIERKNADYARERANYLIEMSVSLRLMIPNVQTDSGNQHWLCPEELKSFNVVNVD